MTLQSPSTADLYKYSTILEGKLSALPDLRGVNSDLEIKNPQVSVEIDRDKAHTLGLTAQAIEDALSDAYGSRQISTIYAPNNEYWVELELKPEFQNDPFALNLLYVRSSTGQLVPLNTVAKLTPSLGPLSVNHSGQLPAVTISFDVAPGVSLGKALAEVKTLADNTLPSSVTAKRSASVPVVGMPVPQPSFKHSRAGGQPLKQFGGVARPLVRAHCIRPEVANVARAR